jgi:hypothetical protein
VANELSPIKIISASVSASIGITGLAWAIIVNSVNHLTDTTEKQSDALKELTKYVYQQRNEEYKRHEAITAHDNFDHRVTILEQKLNSMENSIILHIIDDNERFRKGGD